jgi:hypothetical protein
MAGQMDGDEKFAAKILGEKEESFDAARGFAEGKNVTVSHAMLRRAIGFLRVRCGIRARDMDCTAA